MRQRKIRLRLRGMLILFAISLVSSVVLLISTYFVRRLESDLEDMAQAKSEVMRSELSNKGTALAKNVAQLSERAIALLDFVFLTEVINRTVKEDPEIIYGAIMDADRRVLVHSAPEYVDRVIDDADARHIAAQQSAGTHDLVIGGRQVLEAYAPITIDGKRWGTIRLGLSLDRLNEELRESEKQSASKILDSVLTILLTAALLLFFGSAVGTILAWRIAMPLHALLEGARKIEHGEFDHHLAPPGPNHFVEPAMEFVELGRAFNEMARAVKDRNDALRTSNVELKDALDRAEEASRLKSEFVASVSHELRTPLNAIVNIPVALLDDYEQFPLLQCDSCGAEFQSEDAEAPVTPQSCPDCGALMSPRNQLLFVGDPDEHRGSLQRIAQSGQHLLNVVNDLLDFSKLEAGKMMLSFSNVDVSALISDVALTMGGLADQKSVEVVYPKLAESFALDADKVKLSQVLINLIGNAIKYTPRGGKVDITVAVGRADRGEIVHFAVRDTGEGMPEEKLEVIFESFRQLDGGPTRRYGGTGLGLAISRKLVELHQGRIWAESRMGQGSVFHVTLPKRREA